MFLTQQNRILIPSLKSKGKTKNVVNLFTTNAVVEDIKDCSIVLKTQDLINGKQLYATIQGINPNNFKTGDVVYPKQTVGKEAWDNSINIQTFFK